jgi:hypothetical protein
MGEKLARSVLSVARMRSPHIFFIGSLLFCSLSHAGESLVGNWSNGAVYQSRGDLLWLTLLSDGRFSCTRCLDDDCGRAVAEDGRYVVEREQIAFFLGGGSAAGPTTPRPQDFLDRAYYFLGGGVLTLAREDGASFSLGGVSDERLCLDSGGTYSPGCDCGVARIFSPGQGGCVVAPRPSEALCDASGGGWTDDDVNLLGTYCECPRDLQWLDGVGCAPVLCSANE